MGPPPTADLVPPGPRGAGTRSSHARSTPTSRAAPRLGLAELRKAALGDITPGILEELEDLRPDPEFGLSLRPRLTRLPGQTPPKKDSRE